MLHKRAYLLSLTSSNAPLGNSRTTTAGRDDDVAFAGYGRQRDDAIEAEEGDAHAVQIATCTTPNKGY